MRHEAGVAVIACLLICGCAPESDYQPRVAGGDAGRGRAALVQYECGVCHEIPGIHWPAGQVGPSLDRYAHRPYVAGKFPNEPGLLVRWIRDAPALNPLTAMPAIDMPEGDARDIAAYLYEAGS